MAYPAPPSQQPPQRRGLPTYAKVLIVFVVLFVIGVGLAIFIGVRYFTRQMSTMMAGGPVAEATPADAALFAEQWRQALPGAPTGANAPPRAVADMFSFPACVSTYDLDGDGADEVIAANMFGSVNVFDDDGTPICTVNVGQNAMPMGGRLEGEPKLFVAKRWGKTVQAYGLDGVMMWSYTAAVPMPTLPSASAAPPAPGAPPMGPAAYGTGISCVRIADIDGDGKDEVLVGYQGPPGLQCVSGDQEQKLLWQYGAIGGTAGVATGDVDGDGKVEVLAVDSSGAIHVLDAAGGMKTRWSLMVPAPVIAVEDLDGDGTAEVLLAGGMPMPGSPQSNVTVYGLDSNGATTWTEQVAGGGMMSMMGPSVPVGAADLNGDGTKVWVIAGGDGSLNVIPTDGSAMQTHNTGLRIKDVAALRVAGEDTDWIVAATAEEVVAYRPVGGKF